MASLTSPGKWQKLALQRDSDNANRGQGTGEAPEAFPSGPIVRRSGRPPGPEGTSHHAPGTEPASARRRVISPPTGTRLYRRM